MTDDVLKKKERKKSLMFKFSTMRLYLPTLYIFCWYEEISGSRQRESRKKHSIDIAVYFCCLAFNDCHCKDLALKTVVKHKSNINGNRLIFYSNYF